MLQKYHLREQSLYFYDFIELWVMRMNMTTVAVSRDLRAKLMELKISENARSFDELLRRMLVIYKKYRFLETNMKVRKRMRELGISLEELTE